MEKTKFSNATILKFFLINAIGIFMFFIPITIGGKNTIAVDHIVSYIRMIPNFDLVYGGAIIILGAIIPILNKTWNKTTVATVFSIFRVIGIGVFFIFVFKIGPETFHRGDMLPFLFGKVVAPVTTLVPIGAIFLAFLINYGLMEFVGVIVRPIMRPIWKTPGRSAIDAVASFVGSYSVGLLITNRVYKEGYYSDKEASIIATGFSTVSATFMVIVAGSAGIMDNWNVYFWGTLVITFLVTAITTRIYPLSKKSDLSYEGKPVIPEPEVKNGKLLQTAAVEGLKSCEKAPSILEGIMKNSKDGIMLALTLGPTLISIGFLGLLLAEYTPIFDIIGYLFLPFTMLLGFGAEAGTMATASAISLAEMFLPMGLLSEASQLAKSTMAIVCVSEIIFFSASVPCILSTEIKLSIKDLIIIWFERVVLSLLIATPFAMFFLS